MEFFPSPQLHVAMWLADKQFVSISNSAFHPSRVACEYIHILTGSGGWQGGCTMCTKKPSSTWHTSTQAQDWNKLKETPAANTEHPDNISGLFNDINCPLRYFGVSACLCNTVLRGWQGTQQFLHMFSNQPMWWESTGKDLFIIPHSDWLSRMEKKHRAKHLPSPQSIDLKLSCLLSKPPRDLQLLPKTHALHA